MSHFTLIIASFLPHLAGALQAQPEFNDTRVSSPTEVGSIHVLLGRAVFDYQDHVQRISAIRDTWGSAPGVQLHVLDFGKDIFESGYKDWCRGCPASAYATAPEESQIPADILKSPLYAVDGHAWAMRQALADPTCEWILIGQDMLSINIANMRKYLSKYDPSQKWVLGNRLEGYPAKSVSVSPWGYLISRGVADALVSSWEGVRGYRNLIDKDRNLRVHGGSTDDGLCLVFHKIGAKFLDTRDEEGRDRMFLWPPSRIQQHSWYDDWYPSRRIDAVKKELSPETFMFFFAGSKEIRALGSLYDRRASLLGNVASGGSKVSTLYTESTLQLLEPMISQSTSA